MNNFYHIIYGVMPPYFLLSKNCNQTGRLNDLPCKKQVTLVTLQTFFFFSFINNFHLVKSAQILNLDF